MTDRGGERPSEFSAPSVLVNEEILLETVFERITGHSEIDPATGKAVSLRIADDPTFDLRPNVLRYAMTSSQG